nr:hypothetical protein [Tanacetum cinerariifolium]
MQAELEEEERLARLKEEETNTALVAEWDNTQPMMDADCKLAARLQEEEREELTIKEKSRFFVELMDKRKKHFARLRAEKIRSKPPTKAQKWNQMCTYLKNMANYKHNQLKNKCFEEIQILFNSTMNKKAQEGSSIRAANNLEQEDAKRQRIEEEDETAEHKICVEIIPEDDDYNMVYYLLVEKMYLFTRNFLLQMWNDVRLQVDYEVEMAYDLLRLIRRQINEGYVPE